MAIVSSHTLDSVLGMHAGGIQVELFRLAPTGARVRLFRTQSDAGGRLAKDVTLGPEHADDEYEIVFQSGEYFADHSVPNLGNRIIKEVVVRFRMPDPDGRYHIPLMLAPNSYSVWWSS